MTFELSDALELEHLYQVRDRVHKRIDEVWKAASGKMYGCDSYGFCNKYCTEAEVRVFCAERQDFMSVALLDSFHLIKVRIKEISLGCQPTTGDIVL